MSSAETVGFDGLNRLSHTYVSPKSKMEETVLVLVKSKPFISLKKKPLLQDISFQNHQ
jgi:hypothetical protein